MAAASSSSSSTAPAAAAETPAAPASSTSAPLPVPSSAPVPRRRRVREVSSRYLSTTTPLPAPSPRLSTSSLHSAATPLVAAPSPRHSTSSSSFHSATPLPAAPASPRLSTSSSHPSTPSTSTRAHHHGIPAAASSGLADENRPPPPPTPGSRKRGAQDLFEEMHRPRQNPPAPLAAAATATPGSRRILCPSSRASPNIATAARQHHRKGCARPSTPAVRTSLSLYGASPETSAAAIDSRAAAAPSPRHVPFPELKTSPPARTEGPCRPPDPFCFQALALALPDRRRKMPAAAVKPAAPLPPRKVVVVKKGAAVLAGSRAAGKQEDVHKLRILDNCYIQYRFLNAQAEAAAMTKKAVAEESLCGLSERIANLQRSVAQKRAELECLKRMEKVDFVVDAQVPSLEQWCELEREHISCLASGTVALREASSHVPIRGNIKINIGEVKSALNSAMGIMKQLSPCAEKFSRKAGEIKDVALDLNNVVSKEQVLLQECADLLHQAHDMQVMEDSLRILVMQLKNQAKNKT